VIVTKKTVEFRSEWKFSSQPNANLFWDENLPTENKKLNII